MSTLATIPKPAWAAYRVLHERMEAARGTERWLEAMREVQVWEMEAQVVHGHVGVSDIADLLARLDDAEWAVGQVAHLQRDLDEVRRERDALLRDLAASERPCGEAGQ